MAGKGYVRGRRLGDQGREGEEHRVAASTGVKGGGRLLAAGVRVALGAGAHRLTLARFGSRVIFLDLFVM
jgi:hypothetical protein